MYVVQSSCRIALVIGLALAFAIPAPAQTFRAADYFPLDPGSEGTYLANGTTLETWRVLPQTAVVDGITTRIIGSSQGEAFYMTNDAEGLREHQESAPSATVAGATDTLRFTPFKFADAVFSLGTTVQNSGNVFLNEGFVGTYIGSSQILGTERVTVPAGTFDTIRTHRTMRFFINGAELVDDTDFWLGNGVGIVRTVQVTSILGGSSMELVASNRLPALHAAVLPASRSARVGNAISAFAMVINAGPTAANACSIALSSPIPATMNYQTTDETTNALTGTVNTPVSIPAGGRQSFVIGVTPSDAFSPTEVQFSFDCENSAPAGVLVGINTLLMSASNTAVPDLIALAATTGNNGIVDVPGVGGVGAFAVASVNLGSGGSITVSADTGSVAVPANLSVCQTDPQSGICIGEPTGSVSTLVNTDQTPTFGVFVQSTDAVPFSPGVNRVYVRFRDITGTVRGATSVAVRTI